jgi:hypothetical protein
VPVTLTTTADVTELARFRQQAKVGWNDLFVKAAALCLEKHPHLAARLEGSRSMSKPVWSFRSSGMQRR